LVPVKEPTWADLVRQVPDLPRLDARAVPRGQTCPTRKTQVPDSRTPPPPFVGQVCPTSCLSESRTLWRHDVYGHARSSPPALWGTLAYLRNGQLILASAPPLWPSEQADFPAFRKFRPIQADG